MTDTTVELETVEPVGRAAVDPPGQLLLQLTRRVLESALEGEITDHLDYEKHEAAGRGSGNSRNGGRAKSVLADVGPVEVKVPRDASAP
ncbi:transposase-like protein [Streptomyces sp. V3I8]|nr:transposase-like protein [Streptomyces sp. V3I8]